MQGASPTPYATLRRFRPWVLGQGALLLLAASTSASSAQPGERNRIHLNAGLIQTDGAKAKQQRTAALQSFSGKRLHLVQFSGPIQPKDYKVLGALGFRVVCYVPENAYLVYGDYQAVQGLRAVGPDFGVQWNAPFENSLKVQPGARRVLNTLQGLPSKLAAGLPEAYCIQLVEDASTNSATLQTINKLALGALRQDYRVLGYRNLTVNLAPESLEALAARPDVVSIEAWTAPKKRGETQDMIISGHLVTNGGLATPTGPGYLTWLADKGFTQAQFDASDFAVDISDSGVDNGTTDPNHFGLHRSGDVNSASRIIYNRLQGTPNASSTIQGCDGHGNLNTHIIGGFNDYAFSPQVDGSGYHYGLGVNPFIRVGSSVVFDPATFTNPSYPDLMAEAYRDKARINSNSWGADSAAYGTDSQAYDALVRDAQPEGSTVATPGNQEMVIVFSAGNKGSGAGTIGSPGNAKNVIAVGASEDVNPFGAADGCGISDAEANNALDLASFSSRGPTADGRKKPDIVAPGTHVSGGVFQAAKANPDATALGAASSCFTAEGVCAGPGTSQFFPSTEQWFTASSGTSHSCPAVAGAASLLRQYFLNKGWSAPSPAMTKAFLMNSARYMTGLYTNDALYSNNQGMGLLDLGQGFDGVARILKDQRPGDLFTASGQLRVVTGTITDASKPFRVTLAWTDAPGASFAAPYCNNLDLTVLVGGQEYKGNVFVGATSVTGGEADLKNNVESVFLPAGVTGDFVVLVQATNINSIGVPDGTDTPNQDYALTVYNAAETTAPFIAFDGATLKAEGCSPANLAPDPGENLSYQFTFRNLGTAAASDLKVTLGATGGVTQPSGVLSLGALNTEGTVSGQFSFQVDPAWNCSTPLTLTFHFQDGTTDLGTAIKTLDLGTLTPGGNWSSGAIAVAIPDNLPAGVLIPLTISDTGLAKNLKVKIRANHAWDSDLTFALVAPDGTSVVLAAGVGNKGGNFGASNADCTGTPTVFSDGAATAIGSGTAPFAGTYAPAEALAALDGKALAGIWSLKVVDSVLHDTGTVYCFQLETDTRTCNTCAAAAPAITSFSPTSALRGGTVVIQGTGFAGASSVSFNGASAAFTVDSNTQISAQVPLGATNGPLSVTTPSGTSTSSASFLLMPIVTLVAKPPAILVGSSYTFSANLVDAAQAGINWTASAGTPLTGSGASYVWTAPAVAGAVTITATSVQNGAAHDSAIVTIKTTDLDGNGTTEVSDLSALSAAYHSHTGDPAFLAGIDLNGDGTIDDSDTTLWLGAF